MGTYLLVSISNDRIPVLKCDIKVRRRRDIHLIIYKIGKNTTNTKNKINFSINNTVITDSKMIADEFNNLFVSIGPQLANNI